MMNRFFTNRIFFLFSLVFFIINYGLFSQKINKLEAISDYYSIVPDISNCKAGYLNDTEKQKVLDKINYIRAIHGLKPVTYNANDDKFTAEAALIMCANSTLSHNPTNSFHCYSEDGKTGASKSNLHLNSYSSDANLATTESSIVGWLIDNYSNEPQKVGHRRAIINPFLNSISIGRADGKPQVGSWPFATGMAIKVFNTDKQDLFDWANDFVAYPYHDYPSDCFDKDFYLSFSVFWDKTNPYNNIVDFSTVTIKVVDENNNTISVSDINSDNENWGDVRNVVAWKCAGLQDNKKYNVTISNVKYGSNTKEYSYWFRIGSEVVDVLASPALSVPANNAKNLETNITLNWQPVTEATKYRVQVSKVSTFAEILKDESNLTNTSFELKDLEYNTPYYWRVLAQNEKKESLWSSFWTFRTKSSNALAAPVLYSPIDGSIDISATTQLKWNSVTGASSYNIQIANSNAFSEESIIHTAEEVTGRIYNIPTGVLQGETLYYWRLASVASDGTIGSWGDSWKFTTSKINSISDNFNNNNIEVFNYPNPIENHSNIYINNLDNQFIRIKLFNQLGVFIKTIYEGLYSKNQAIDFDATSFSSGFYYYSVYLNNDVFTKVIIISK